MAHIRRILCASDLSAASRRALAMAVTLAKANHAALTVLHVREPVMPAIPELYIASTSWEQIDRKAQAWARRQLHALVQKAKTQRVRATARLIEGTAADQIVRVARSTKADLLVVGTHGRSGFSKFFLGSVAQRVVAMAPCPVVTVRGA